MVDGKEIPLGQNKGFFYKNMEFLSKDKAIEYINNREGLELKTKGGYEDWMIYYA